MTIKQKIKRAKLAGLAALALAACVKSAKPKIPYSGISGSVCAVPTIGAEDVNAIGLLLQDTAQLTNKPGAVLLIDDIGYATRSPVKRATHAYLRWEGSKDMQYGYSTISIVAPQGHPFYSMKESQLRDMYMSLTKRQSRGMQSANCWQE